MKSLCDTCSVYLAQINTQKNTCKYDNVIITKHFLHVNHTGIMKAHYKHRKLRNSVPIITIKGEGQFARCSNWYYKQIERYVFFLTIIRPDYNSSQKKMDFTIIIWPLPWWFIMELSVLLDAGVAISCPPWWSISLLSFEHKIWSFRGFTTNAKLLTQTLAHSLSCVVTSPFHNHSLHHLLQLLFVAWFLMTSSTIKKIEYGLRTKQNKNYCWGVI